LKIKVSIIAGGAGFIGSNLIRYLQSEKRHIVVIDNMCRGSKSFLNSVLSLDRHSISILEGDCADQDFLHGAFILANEFGDLDEVWHLAANSDIPAGIADANVDLKDTFLTTFALLEVMKRFKVSTINFASSSAIYGDFGGVPIYEEIGPLLPISNYGAMKLASEALISAAVESYLERANIFRFPNVVGIPATHGVILDFVRKLIVKPECLMVLGDGSQQKAYLHVSDLIEAMLLVRSARLSKKIELVNIGPIDHGVSVRSIAEWVVERVSPTASIQYGEGNKGWVGDVSKFSYSTKRLQSYGWTPKLDSAGAVNKAINEIALQLGQ
jgi:UDP-glucose 4-epimerase